jgi:hypothetical protein
MQEPEALQSLRWLLLAGPGRMLPLALACRAPLVLCKAPVGVLYFSHARQPASPVAYVGRRAVAVRNPQDVQMSAPAAGSGGSPIKTAGGRCLCLADEMLPGAVHFCWPGRPWNGKACDNVLAGAPDLSGPALTCGKEGMSRPRSLPAAVWPRCTSLFSDRVGSRPGQQAYSRGTLAAIHRLL